MQLLGFHLLDQDFGRQTCVAMSSGGSELYALILCAARLIFTKNLVDGFGFPLEEGAIANSNSYQRQDALRIAKVLGSSSIFKSEVSGYKRPKWMDRSTSTGSTRC